MGGLESAADLCEELGVRRSFCYCRDEGKKEHV